MLRNPNKLHNDPPLSKPDDFYEESLSHGRGSIIWKEEEKSNYDMVFPFSSTFHENMVFNVHNATIRQSHWLDYAPHDLAFAFGYILLAVQHRHLKTLEGGIFC